MNIKHLIISGGGTVGLTYLGIFQKLFENNVCNINNIETIFSTSAGSLVATILCLDYDRETLNKYIVERPWKDVFKLSGKQIIESYCNKGLYDKKVIEIILKPLLEAKDLPLSITLKEFYEYRKVELNFLTFELNSFKSVKLNYKLFPDLSLLTALTMSSAIPGLFMPILSEGNNTCYIDGAVMANYPLSFCLEMGYNKEEILGVRYLLNDNNIDNFITKDSSILDFILGFSMNAMNFISNKIPINIISNEIICNLEESPTSFNFFEKAIKSSEIRKRMIENGNEIAETFINNLIKTT